MNQTTIYIGIAVVVLIVIIVAVMMSKTQVKTETKTEVLSCNLGYEIQNSECKFVACPSGFYNDINEKKCKKRTKVCPSPQRACETVTENPNADDCITDISRCACEFGKYKNNAGVCTPYSDSVMREYNDNKDNPCKNVSLDPNADRVNISNKPDGTVCRTEGAYQYLCQGGNCSNNRKCAPGYYDAGNNTCISDCKDNGDKNINNKKNMTCVNSCPVDTYYNKIMNGSAIVRNECVSDCRNARSPNFYGNNSPLFNYENLRGKFCISCRQDLQYVKNEGGSFDQNRQLLSNARSSFESVYGGNVLGEGKTGVYSFPPVREPPRVPPEQSFIKFYNDNCTSQ